MRKSCLFALTIACTWFFFQTNVFAQGPSKPKGSSALADEFDKYIQQAQRVWKTPGLSVVVVKDGQVLLQKGYGFTKAGTSEPFTSSTQSVCASTTKAMTAVCMGMLVDEGKLKWTEKVRNILPEFSLYDPYVSSELTVLDLFTHNAGLGEADDLWGFGYSREEILRRMRYLKPAYPYHSSFIYSNLMYLVAGEVIHRVSGQTWEAFITNRLFHELGMNHSYAGFDLSSGEKSHETPHYLIKDSVVAIKNLTYPNVGPAGGVWSCTADMEKWISFLLDSGYTREKKRLLSAASYQEIFKPQSMVTKAQFYPTAELTKPNWMTYGLGWFQEDYRGKMLEFHTGSLPGVVAIIGLVPSSRFGIYVFGNLDHTEIRHALMYKAIDLWCFDDDSRDWSTDLYAMYHAIGEKQKKAQQEKDAMVILHSKPSLPMASYAGRYFSEIFGDAEVQQQGDSLQIVLPNNIIMQLSHRDFDNFNGIYNYFWWNHALVRFSLDADAKVSQLAIDGLLYSRSDK